MSACAWHDELMQALRAGQWPQGCAAELREHVAGCARCAEEARVTLAFAAARENAMRAADLPSSGLLWWKAQLRRRRSAMEQLERPAATISVATIAASVAVLLAVLATVWKRVEWSRLATMFSPAGWNVWVLGSIAVLLCAFAVVAVVVGLGLPEERG